MRTAQINRVFVLLYVRPDKRNREVLREVRCGSILDYSINLPLGIQESVPLVAASLPRKFLRRAPSAPAQGFNEPLLSLG